MQIVPAHRSVSEQEPPAMRRSAVGSDGVAGEACWLVGTADGVGGRWWGALVAGWRLGTQRWAVSGLCGWLSARPFVRVRK